jgi:DNA polymerase-3 subunit delta
VVVVSEADRFITAHRERLEKFLASPSPIGTLVLTCRAFPKTTRLYKAAASIGQVIECKKLNSRGLVDFALGEARRFGKALAPAAAARLVALVGDDQGVVAGEVEKLALFVDERTAITEEDIAALVGLSREEKIFAVMDAAGAGKTAQALALWRQTLASDAGAEYKALGGVAFVLRRWLSAQEALEAGEGLRSLAPKLMMWGREQELGALLRRLPVERLKRKLAAVADLDSQAKIGARSIEGGVEALLIDLASAS